MDTITVQRELDANRKSVSFDSYDITVRQLVDMVNETDIDIAPAYQRHFVWDSKRQSSLIESLFLGIPIPSLFMATNTDSTWEAVDGVQRLTTIMNFVASEDQIRKNNAECKKLKLDGLEKLISLNGVTYDQLPKSLQLLFMTRPIRVTVLNDRSDLEVRYDLFERLNTGGVTLHPQEIRNCVYMGKFNDLINELAGFKSFRKVTKLAKNAEKNGNYEELVLKFFAYYFNREKFVHGVKVFLNEYMEEMTNAKFDVDNYRNIFTKTFDCLAENLPNGIVRGKRKNITPLVLYEAITIGTADALDRGQKIKKRTLVNLLDDENLNFLTTGATNSRSKLVARIDYVREAFI